MCKRARPVSPGAGHHRSTSCIAKRTHRAALPRRHDGCWLLRLTFSRVLFLSLMEAGAGKQNAMIVVRRYAGLAVIVGLGLLLSSPANLSQVVSALPEIPRTKRQAFRHVG